MTPGVTKSELLALAKKAFKWSPRSGLTVEVFTIPTYDDYSGYKVYVAGASCFNDKNLAMLRVLCEHPKKGAALLMLRDSLKKMRVP